MDFKKLRHLIILFEEKSFTKACDKLNITQSALSRSIQSIESELGLQIFDRNNKRVAPTMEGQYIIQKAKYLLSQYNDLKLEAKSLAHGESGHVKFGLGPMFSPIISEILQNAWLKSQKLFVQVEILPIAKMIDLVINEEMDFFLADTSFAQEYSELKIDPITIIGVGYFVRNTHPLLKNKKISKIDLANYSLVSPSLNSKNSNNSIYSATNWQGSIYCENLDALKTIALQSDAVFLTMENVIKKEISNGSLVKLQIEEFDNWNAAIGIVSLKSKKTSGTAKKFIQAIKNLLLENVRQP